MARILRSVSLALAAALLVIPPVLAQDEEHAPQTPEGITVETLGSAATEAAAAGPQLVVQRLTLELRADGG